MRRTSNKIWLMPDKHTCSSRRKQSVCLVESPDSKDQFDCAPFGLTEREAQFR